MRYQFVRIHHGVRVLGLPCSGFCCASVCVRWPTEARKPTSNFMPIVGVCRGPQLGLRAAFNKKYRLEEICIRAQKRARRKSQSLVAAPATRYEALSSSAKACAVFFRPPKGARERPKKFWSHQRSAARDRERCPRRRRKPRPPPRTARPRRRPRSPWRPARARP